MGVRGVCEGGKGKTYAVAEVDVDGGTGDDGEFRRDGCAERGGDEGIFDLHGCLYIDVKSVRRYVDSLINSRYLCKE